MKIRIIAGVLAIALLLSVGVVASAEVTTAEEDAAAEAESVFETQTQTDEEPAAAEKRADLAATGASSDFVKLLLLSHTKSGLKLTFSAFSGAEKYRVFEKSGSSWTKVGDTKTTSFEHKNLSNNSQHTYTVRALKNGAYCSAFDPAGLSAKFLKAPIVKTLESVFGGMKVGWNKVDGAKLYQLFSKTSAGWKTLVTTDATSFIDTSAKNGQSCRFAVRCVSETGEYESSFENPPKKATFVSSPTVSKFENQKSGTKLFIAVPSGAKKVRVFVKESGKWKKLGDTASSTFIHKVLSDQKTYTYTVRGMNAKGKYITGHSEQGWTNRFLSPPVISGVDAKASEMTVKWNRKNNVSAYRVYRKTYGSDWVKQAEVETTSFLDTSFPQDKPYTYTVRCLDKNNKTISYFVSYAKWFYQNKVAEGTIKFDSKSIYFRNGKPYSGYRTVNEKKYYYKSGVIQKNGIVGTKAAGYFYADKNGVCCVSEEMRLAAEFLMNECKGKTVKDRMKNGFMVLAKKYPYNRTYDHPKKAADLPRLGIDIFNRKMGNCFRYAVAYACVAKAAGYRSRVIIGRTGYNPHGWTEVLVNGRWLICDVDANIPAYCKPDYAAYMIRYHYWPLTYLKKCELTINAQGKAVWKET